MGTHIQILKTAAAVPSAVSSWCKDYSTLHRKPKQNFTNTFLPGRRAVEGAPHCHQPLFPCLSHTSHILKSAYAAVSGAVLSTSSVSWSGLSKEKHRDERCFSIWVSSPVCFRSQPYYSCLNMTGKLLKSSAGMGRSGRAQEQGQERLRTFFPSKTTVTTPHPHENVFRKSGPDAHLRTTLTYLSL